MGTKGSTNAKPVVNGGNGGNVGNGSNHATKGNAASATSPQKIPSGTIAPVANANINVTTTSNGASTSGGNTADVLNNLKLERASLEATFVSKTKQTIDEQKKTVEREYQTESGHIHTTSAEHEKSLQARFQQVIDLCTVDLCTVVDREPTVGQLLFAQIKNPTTHRQSFLLSIVLLF
jgi:hypothetical protein